MTNQETGATLLYHGQVVWFEWQSRKARSKIAATSGATCTCACMVRSGSTAGLVLAGRTNCATRNSTTTIMPVHFNLFLVFSFILISCCADVQRCYFACGGHGP